MEMLPILRVPVHFRKFEPDRSINGQLYNFELVFKLESNFAPPDKFWYTCLTTYQATGNQKDCVSPEFEPYVDDRGRKYIPYPIYDWIMEYTRYVTVGAYWGWSLKDYCLKSEKT